MIFNEAFKSIADSNDVVFLDELGVFSFEEGSGGGGFVSDDAIDHGYFESLMCFNDLVIC